MLRKQFIILTALVVVIGLYALFAALWDRSDPKAAMLHNVSADYRVVWKIALVDYPEGGTADIPDATWIGYEVRLQEKEIVNGRWTLNWVDVDPDSKPYSVAHAFLDGATSGTLYFQLNSRYPGEVGQLGITWIDYGDTEKLYAMILLHNSEEYVVEYVNID